MTGLISLSFLFYTSYDFFFSEILNINYDHFFSEILHINCFGNGSYFTGMQSHQKHSR